MAYNASSTSPKKSTKVSQSSAQKRAPKCRKVRPKKEHNFGIDFDKVLGADFGKVLGADFGKVLGADLGSFLTAI